MKSSNLVDLSDFSTYSFYIGICQTLMCIYLENFIRMETLRGSYDSAFLTNSQGLQGCLPMGHTLSSKVLKCSHTGTRARGK